MVKKKKRNSDTEVEEGESCLDDLQQTALKEGIKVLINEAFGVVLVLFFSLLLTTRTTSTADSFIINNNISHSTQLNRVDE